MIKFDFLRLDELPFRPIVSNIGTTTYKTAKYKAKLLLPLGKWDCTGTNMVDFIKRIKKGTTISFDVKSLFSNVPLEETIPIILRNTYEECEIITNIQEDN